MNRQFPQQKFLGRVVFTLGFASLTALSGGCQFAASGQNASGARLYEQGQYTAALQQFQQAIASDPQNADGYYNLAATNHRIGQTRGDAKVLEQAEALYNQCLDHDPNHVECHRGLAVLLSESGWTDRAFALVKNWATQNPQSSQPRIELARLYEEFGEPATALKYLEDAVLLNANDSRAWLALGRLREKSGELTQAVQNYQQSLAINGAQPAVSERIAALSRQINSNIDASRAQGGTQIATPLGYGNSRY